MRTTMMVFIGVKLEAVFGRTAVSPNSLAVHEQTGRIAYVAGASVVLTCLDGTQAFGEGHLVGAARHPFTCLAFSSCGRYMATGESGHQPHVRLWEIYDDVGNFTGQSIRSFPFHSNSVVAVVNAIAISPDNTICVTVGSKHVKYWHLPAADSQGAGMQSRSAILADRRSSVFVDVVFLDNNKVLAVTEDGALVEFLNKKYVKTYRYDDHSIPLCVSVTKEDVVLGFTNGVIRLYDKDDLTLRGRLPHPAFIGMDPASASSVEALEIQPQQARYPDVRALCCTSSMRESFIAAYSDRSIFVFERGKGSDPWRKLSSSMAHVGPVTVVKRYPSHFIYLPSGSFITAGADGTVRIWNMSRKCDRVCSIPSSNLLSSTLKKIIYVEENFSALVEPRGGMPYLFASGGRDRLVHLFRPGKTSYEHCNVIDDHQSALNAVRFVQKSDELYLFTCGSDKTIIIWRLVLFTHNAVQFNRENQISSQMGINDLLIPISGNILLTSCQDRQLRAYSLSGKLLTTFCLDPSGIYAASVCSDRHVYMVEVRSGKCLAALTGIGESATDVEFSEDCRSAVSDFVLDV
ncbi:unnamed protein product [Angiostrongylus costaricensis]|uniref:WD_REPEATS_REGION domain-containing protein n=1 Tax=Angiostrongylus costaricensis TaxID=334426 RepID=A0A158PDF6_ANGCS|nr:unnamed protein product [Angiostrongylus costaricensis]